MTESLAKISSMLESARDLTIEVAASASSRLSETPSALRPKEISKLLNSRTDRDILSGMKCVISLIARGEDGLPYFADVVKNITSTNNKVKNLVLIYLTRYAEVEPDTALLSINSIQKSLNDKNPITRANAIRSLAGIRIPSIVPILLLCIKRTISDPSPLVRGSTAIAIGKVYDIETSKKKQLLEYLSKLLADSDSQVVGTAIKIYFRIMPHLSPSHKKWEPIHGNFRRFCNIISELDEWSQAFLIEILTEYSRIFLPRPKLYLKDGSTQVMDLPDDYSKILYQNYDVSMDKDLQLFIDSLKPLVYSKSEFVILSVSKAIYSLAPPLVYQSLSINVAITRLVSSLNCLVSLYALQTVSLISSSDRLIFAPYYKKFYVYPTDSISVAKMKLEVLSLLANEENLKFIFEELKYYSTTAQNSEVAGEAIRAIGSCSQISSYWNERILKWSLKQIKIIEGTTLNELLTVIRYLIQHKQNFADEAEKKEIIKSTFKLSSVLKEQNSSLESDAKASIIWIIGEFTEAADNKIGPDALRLLIKTFAYESDIVRYEILVLSAKILSYELDKLRNEVGEDNYEEIDMFLKNNIVSKMFQHVLHLAKYDPSYDTRDRARMFNVLLNSGREQFPLASLFLRVPKPVPLSKFSTNGVKDFGNVLTANILVKYFSTIEWADPATHPPSSIRKEIPIQSNNLGGRISSISSSSMPNKSSSPEPISEHAISSHQYQKNTVDRIIPKPSYQLQSLDEFFGNEDSEQSESTDYDDDEDGDDDSLIELENNSEEEEDEDDENEEEEEEEDEEEEDEEDDDEEEEDSSDLMENYSSDEDQKGLLANKVSNR